MSHYGPEREAEEALSNPDTETLLKERGKDYGDFGNLSSLSQGLKNAILQHYYNTHGQDKAPPLPPFLIEGVSMICHKLARMANGNPLLLDNMDDIAGYAERVAEELRKSST